MPHSLFRYGVAVLLLLVLAACDSSSGGDDSGSGSMSGTPGVTAGATSGNTNENGATASFTVVLDAEPLADVVVSITSGDLSEITVVGSGNLTFTATDWNTPQTVTITGVDDQDVDGTVPVTMTVTAGNTGGYNGETTAVQAANDDDGKEMLASRDNMLYESSVNPAGWSNGGGTNMYVGRTGNSNQAPLGVLRRGLIAFDIAAVVPAGATITSAMLTMYVNNVRNNTGRDTSLHRLLVDWGEGTAVSPGNESGGTNAGVPAAAAANDATWSHRLHDGGAAGEWANTAGGQAGADYVGAASATVSVTNMLTSVTWSGAGLVADIQLMLDNPASNFGWMMLGDEATSQSVKVFSTREHPAVADRPLLILDYTL